MKIHWKINKSKIQKTCKTVVYKMNPNTLVENRINDNDNSENFWPHFVCVRENITKNKNRT